MLLCVLIIFLVCFACHLGLFSHGSVDLRKAPGIRIAARHKSKEHCEKKEAYDG